jgi:adenine-specific DNA methylase
MGVFFFWGEKMNQQIVLTIVEIIFSLIVEGIILSMIFNYISDKHQEKQQKNLQNEMNNIETQNKFIYEQLQKEIRDTKTDLISQIKESSKGGSK